MIRKWMSVEDDTYDGEDKSYGDVCTHMYKCVSGVTRQKRTYV